MTGEAWWRGAVIYQIYPRSFMDSNGDGVGDLPGITGKLDHVASLGVDGIWLSPFFTSPMADYGYDVSNYRDVDPLFGTLADFDALLAKAHALSLKVIIDQVYSHTSEAHAWFKESAASRDNPKADWYVWADPKPDGTPPNNWLSVFGGSAWTWSARRRQYYLHNFLTQQPDLNFHSVEVQQAILDVARFWLDRGVDGFRLDVANYYFHDAALTDNPPADYAKPPGWTYAYQRHLHDKSQPQTLGFLRRLRAVTDQYADRMMLGEIGDDHPLERQLEYTAGQDLLHTAYSFHLLDGRKGSADLFKEAIEPWRAAEGWPSWSLGNHDFVRFPTRLGGASPGADQVDALMAALFCLRGTLFLYEGDELGLPQANVPFEKLRDPYAIAAYTGDSGRDGTRTPFPWSASAPHAGFTRSDDPWLPIDPRHAAMALDTQEGKPDSHLGVTRELVALRKAHAALRVGSADVLDAPADVLAVLRAAGNEQVLCVVNLGAGVAVVEHPALKGGSLLAPSHLAALGDGLTLGPYGRAFVAVG
jgi:alpha-glucosidase